MRLIPRDDTSVEPVLTGKDYTPGSLSAYTHLARILQKIPEGGRMYFQVIKNPDENLAMSFIDLDKRLHGKLSGHLDPEDGLEGVGGLLELTNNRVVVLHRTKNIPDNTWVGAC